MTKLGRFWTDAVAYVALATGAGLSIAGNVANVLRTRGQLVDTLDIVLAVAFPALVVLMVEVFVSSRWQGLARPMQVLRWTGTLAIGAMAMRVSWVHLNELMTSRNQTKDVAIIAPLAIDALAIMATALILAGRGQPASRIVPVPLATAAPTVPLATVVPTVQATESDLFARLERDMATENPTLPVPVSPAPTGGDRPARVKLSAEAAETARVQAAVAAEAGVLAGDLSEALGAIHGVSARTIRRQPWWTEATRKRAPQAA